MRQLLNDIEKLYHGHTGVCGPSAADTGTGFAIASFLCRSRRDSQQSAYLTHIEPVLAMVHQYVAIRADRATRST